MKKLIELTSGADAIRAIMDCFKVGNYQAALAATDALKGPNGTTNNAAYCFFHGSMLMQLGRYAEAETWLRKNIEVESRPQQLALGLSTLGQLLMKLDRFDEALQCFEKGLQHWPDKGGLRRDIAEASLRRGDDPAAVLPIARLAVEQESNPNSSIPGAASVNLAENLATLAWVVAAASADRNEVERIVTRAVPLVGSEYVSSLAQVHYHSGLAYATLGDRSSSMRHLERAAQSDPYGIFGRDAKAMLQGFNGQQ